MTKTRVTSEQEPRDGRAVDKTEHDNIRAEKWHSGAE
jgi:hypothetical protein